MVYLDEDSRGPTAARVSEVAKRIMDERSVHEETRATREIDPPNMPQVERELSLVTGVLQSVEASVARLIVKIGPVCSVATNEIVRPDRREDEWEVTAPIAVQLRKLYQQLLDLETELAIATMRVQL